VLVFAGQVILDKLRTVKTVVHKTQIIDSTFRNFDMEVIAGEPNFVTLAREHGFSYKLDFSKVYWNPRLCKVSSCIFAIIVNLEMKKSSSCALLAISAIYADICHISKTWYCMLLYELTSAIAE